MKSFLEPLVVSFSAHTAPTSSIPVRGVETSTSLPLKSRALLWPPVYLRSVSNYRSHILQIMRKAS